MEYRILYGKERLNSERKHIDFEYKAFKGDNIAKCLILLIFSFLLFIGFILFNMFSFVVVMLFAYCGYFTADTHCKVKKSKATYIKSLEINDQLGDLLSYNIVDVRTKDSNIIVRINTDKDIDKYKDCDSIFLVFDITKEIRVTESLTPTRVDFYCDEVVLVY